MFPELGDLKLEAASKARLAMKSLEKTNAALAKLLTKHPDAINCKLPENVIYATLFDLCVVNKTIISVRSSRCV